MLRNNWIKHAKDLQVNEIIDNYVDEIEELTSEYNQTDKMKKLLEELVEIIRLKYKDK